MLCLCIKFSGEHTFHIVNNMHSVPNKRVDQLTLDCFILTKILNSRVGNAAPLLGKFYRSSGLTWLEFELGGTQYNFQILDGLIHQKQYAFSCDACSL